MPRFYLDGIFHFSEDKHVAELKHKCRQAFFRIVSLVKTGTKFFNLAFGEPLRVLHGFLRDKCILFGWEKECESFTYLPTLPVFPGVSKFFMKSPGLPVRPKKKIWGVVSRFLYSGGWQVCSDPLAFSCLMDMRYSMFYCEQSHIENVPCTLPETRGKNKWLRYNESLFTIIASLA